MVNHELEFALEPAGILIIETLGPFLLARKLIRDEASFLAMVRTLYLTVICLLPFAAFEALTERPIILDLLGRVATVFGNADMDPRMGLERAQVVFEHPILYGAFCTSTFGLAYYILASARTFRRRFFRCFPIIVAAIFSVSSGAIASIVTQIILLGWDYISRSIRNRWRLFGLLFLSAYMLVDLLSNRTPFHVLVTYLTFSTRSAYNRIHIWNFGSAEVARHPFFGIGLGDWTRPDWMSSSMDNFWLVIAVRYGLPTFLAFAGAVLLIMWRLGQIDIPRGAMMNAYRSGLLVSLGGLIIAGSTVHYWNAIYCLFIFLVGSGVWMIEAASAHSSNHSMQPLILGQKR